MSYLGNPETSVKQDALLSGVNIKTINGQSVMGSGDLPAPASTPADLGKYYKANGTGGTWETVVSNTDSGVI